MLIQRLIGARPEKQHRAWTPLEYGLMVSLLTGVVTVGLQIAHYF